VVTTECSAPDKPVHTHSELATGPKEEQHTPLRGEHNKQATIRSACSCAASSCLLMHGHARGCSSRPVAWSLTSHAAPHASRTLALYKLQALVCTVDASSSPRPLASAAVAAPVARGRPALAVSAAAAAQGHATVATVAAATSPGVPGERRVVGIEVLREATKAGGRVRVLAEARRRPGARALAIVAAAAAAATAAAARCSLALLMEAHLVLQREHLPPAQQPVRFAAIAAGAQMTGPWPRAPGIYPSRRRA